MEVYMIAIYGLLITWTLFSIYYIFRIWTKGINNIIPYIYESIPNVFTTIGVLGTFVGIYFGLREFDVENITESIPHLLEGLKTAFITSIWGISLSLIFGKTTQIVLSYSERKQPPKATGELGALIQINDNLTLSHKENIESLSKLNTALIGDSDDSISSQFIKLRDQVKDIYISQQEQQKYLTIIQNTLGQDDSTSLLTQIQKLRSEQSDIAKGTKDNVELIVDSMNSNNALITRKFDEFSDLLAQNNSEALVDVMKQATEDFNAQMSALIEKLVQENFQELNNSVQQMNDWQKGNMEMISKLTNQFTQVSNDFKISSESIKEITVNTTKLTNDNSHLNNLIQELQKVMIEDTKYQEIVNQLTSTVNTLKENTVAFDNTTNQLNDWVRNQMNFTDSIAALMLRLEEIDKIKDINEVFWKNTEVQLNQGVGIIQEANTRLADDLENINQEFYERLNNTLRNLDTLIQSIIANNN